MCKIFKWCIILKTVLVKFTIVEQYLCEIWFFIMLFLLSQFDKYTGTTCKVVEQSLRLNHNSNKFRIKLSKVTIQFLNDQFQK